MARRELKEWVAQHRDELRQWRRHASSVAAIQKMSRKLRRYLDKHQQWSYDRWGTGQEAYRKAAKFYRQMAQREARILSGHYGKETLMRFYGLVPGPLLYWPPEKWIELFRKVCQPRRSGPPVTLYRGASRMKFARGLSWSPQPLVAYAFAGQERDLTSRQQMLEGDHRGWIWQVEAPPEAILMAHTWHAIVSAKLMEELKHQNQQPQEFICDPALLPPLRRVYQEFPHVHDPVTTLDSLGDDWIEDMTISSLEQGAGLECVCDRTADEPCEHGCECHDCLTDGCGCADCVDERGECLKCVRDPGEPCEPLCFCDNCFNLTLK
jgi:hypothetical protein